MIEFNCTVKDLFRRRDMISKAVWSLADNDYAEHAVIYVRIRTNLINALAYAAANMKDHEYRVAAAYLKSDDSEQTVAQNMYYTLRTVRRYVRKACELINEYYTNELGIRLLPVDTRAIDCRVSPGSFWEKVNSLMDSSIENACAVIVHFSLQGLNKGVQITIVVIVNVCIVKEFKDIICCNALAQHVAVCLIWICKVYGAFWF